MKCVISLFTAPEGKYVTMTQQKRFKKIKKNLKFKIILISHLYIYMCWRKNYVYVKIREDKKSRRIFNGQTTNGEGGGGLIAEPIFPSYDKIRNTYTNLMKLQNLDPKSNFWHTLYYELRLEERIRFVKYTIIFFFN